MALPPIAALRLAGTHLGCPGVHRTLCWHLARARRASALESPREMLAPLVCSFTTIDQHKAMRRWNLLASLLLLRRKPRAEG